jgi:rod shape-determining protein MreC
VQDRKAVRRRRAVFAALVLASMGLVTLYFGESGPLDAIQRGAQAVLSPIESGASTALKPVRDGAGWVGDTFDAQDENDELEAEVEQLRAELAEAQRDALDAEQLRAIVDLGEEPGYPEGVEPVTARVIAQSPTAWFSTIQIDKGSGDGVKVDQPVVTGGGLAGKVTDVTGGTATVTLITDPDSAVSAQVVPSGARGVLGPQVGNPDDLLLDFLEKDIDIEEGASVITSGSTSTRFESLFPRGVPIGEVSEVDPDERELYQRVHIEPYADLRSMDFVQVLTGDVAVESAEVAP